MSKVYVYSRVSTEAQSLEQQERTIHDWLNSHNLECSEVVSDEGISGGISYKKRNLYKLIQRMEQGDTLVVAEISRLGRSMSDLNKLVNDELKPRKLRLVVVSMGIDLDCSKLTAINEMMLYAFSFSAQIEKEMIQERTKSALDVRKNKIANEGGFYNKRGEWVTHLGREAGFTASKSQREAAQKKREAARNNKGNQFVWKYVQNYLKRSKLETKRDFEQLADELNNLNQRTATGLEFNAIRCQALLPRLKSLYENN